MTERTDDSARERRREESALIERVRDGDESALEALHARYAGPLYSLAFQVTRSERSAEDVVQETLLALWKDAGRFDPSKGTLSSWLFALARHKAIDMIRREANVRKRTALELAFFGGLTHVEVAEKLDIPLGTAKTRIRTALLRLREIIGSSLSDGDDEGGQPVRPEASAG